MTPLSYKLTMKMRSPARCLLVTALLSIAGCDQDKPAAATLESGADLYNAYCAGCHLKDGKGQFLQGIPSLVENKLLNPTPLEGYQIQHKIKGNGDDPKRKMPTFTSLTSHQAKLIAQHIETLQ
jgi:mono/diheme cytochrome c family protein